MSFVLTLVEPKVGSENSFPFSRMLEDVICSRRSCMASTCLLAADRSPVTFSPAEFLPENVKTGMVPSLQFTAANLSSTRSMLPGRCLSGHACGRTTGKAVSSVDDFRQLVRITRSRQRDFHRDLLLEVQCRQRLVERLHSKFFLAGLHGRVNLVNLVFSDQVPNS